MSLNIACKMCGVSDELALSAAVGGGARFVGFVFYPQSPRCVAPSRAAALAARASDRSESVGVFVDPTDDDLGAVLDQVALNWIQLHGTEDPKRVADIKQRFGRPVIKALPVAEAADLAAADRYAPVADRLLFDAKPPKSGDGTLPGGNAVAFDWHLLTGVDVPRPWLLSGGLSADNVAEAVSISGARAIDVSSGVEDRPGVKSPEKISAFLKTVSAL